MDIQKSAFSVGELGEKNNSSKINLKPVWKTEEGNSRDSGLFDFGFCRRDGEKKISHEMS